jgi:hypothetical protein
MEASNLIQARATLSSNMSTRLAKLNRFFPASSKTQRLRIESRRRGTKVIETQEPRKLKEFRDLVLSKNSRFWEDAKDIKISISETLSHFARREELIGWVRPSGQANNASTCR